jgi:PAS domain-containing protein
MSPRRRAVPGPAWELPAVLPVVKRVDAPFGVARETGLLAAAKMVAAGAARDLDAVLDALAERARELLGADEATISLRDGRGGFVRQRASLLARVGSPLAVAGIRVLVDGVFREAVESGRAVGVPDVHGDPRVTAEIRAAQPAIASALVAPLVADGETVGVLVVRWVRRHAPDADDVSTAEGLAQHAAVAIQTARLVEELRRARATAEAAYGELDAVLEAVADGVIVFAPDGRMLRANGTARCWLGAPDGTAPVCGSLGSFAAGRPSRCEPLGSLAARALAGEVVTEEVIMEGPTGAPRRIEAVAAPVRGTDGRAGSCVVVARDVTALHDEADHRERLEGAIRTARTVAHEVNNRLQLVSGAVDVLLTRLPGPETAAAAADLTDGVREIGEVVARLGAIVRFEETDVGAGPMLDLDASVPARGIGHRG